MTFEEIYGRFKTPIWRLARRLSNSDDDALDATQEIFIRIWKGLAGFRGEAKLSTWVFQIAWNYLRWRRRQQGRQNAVLVEGDKGEQTVIERTPDEAPDPERRATSSELLARVDAALQELPEHYRVVIWLRDGEDLSYEEIAAALDIPIGTVRSRLARARSGLRRIVEGG